MEIFSNGKLSITDSHTATYNFGIGFKQIALNKDAKISKTIKQESMGDLYTVTIFTNTLSTKNSAPDTFITFSLQNLSSNKFLRK